MLLPTIPEPSPPLWMMVFKTFVLINNIIYTEFLGRSVNRLFIYTALKIDYTKPFLNAIIPAMLVESEYINLRRGIENFDDYLAGKRIGSDVDGVDVLTAQGSLDEFYLRYGVRKHLSDYTYDFEMNDWLIEFEGSKAKEVCFEIWHHPRVLGDSLPVPGAVTLSRHLNKLRIPRITSRPGTTRDITLSWYRKNMPWIRETDIFIQPEGNDKINHGFKVEMIKALGIEIFFEDNPNHAKAIVENTSATVVIVPWPWNSHTIEHPRIIRPFGVQTGNMYSAYNALARRLCFI